MIPEFIVSCVLLAVDYVLVTSVMNMGEYCAYRNRDQSYCKGQGDGHMYYFSWEHLEWWSYWARQAVPWLTLSIIVMCVVIKWMDNWLVREMTKTQIQTQMRSFRRDQVAVVRRPPPIYVIVLVHQLSPARTTSRALLRHYRIERHNCSVLVLSCC